MTPETPQWTQEDVVLLAAATERHHIVFGRTDAMGRHHCGPAGPRNNYVGAAPARCRLLDRYRRGARDR